MLSKKNKKFKREMIFFFIFYLSLVQDNRDYKMFRNIILLLSIFGVTLGETLRSFPLNKELVDNFLSTYDLAE